MQSQRVPNKKNELGFSLVEVAVAMTVILILTGVSLYYLTNHKRLFKPDDQALQLIDVLQEARQRSLTQRETMRVEIDLTANRARLYDENSVSTDTDDVMLKEVKLFTANEVKMATRPTNISYNPPEPLANNTADFRISLYPKSAPNNVCTYRFLSTGRVVNAGENSTGNNAQTKSEVLFIWSPNKDNPNDFEVARAITVVGTTGSIRLWEFSPSSTEANKWLDSRRAGSYGGSSGNTNGTN